MKRRVAFLAISFALSSNASEVQLTPAGDFAAIDGRPGNGLKYKMDAAIAAKLIGAFNALTNPLVIDYEHQTFLAVDNGQPAPAAGWIESLNWKEGKGLFATVQWTDRAKGMIAAGEYKFISPSLEWNKTGEVTGLHPPGLVNYPAIDGMQQVQLSALSRLNHDPEPSEEISMKALLAAVLSALNLKDDVAEADALKSFATLKAKADTADAKDTEIATLKTKSPDPSKYVEASVVETFKSELATLKAGQLARDIEDLVAPALKDGRLLPAQEKWARDLGGTQLAALKTYIESAQPIAALLKRQTNGDPSGTGSNEQDPVAIAKLANAYIAEQAKSGNVVDSITAITHVTAKSKA